ncbi:MAG: DEDD exonuclease domain-containing protein [Actinomycetota bacterium]|nr:DEDD exonuclease domain-containing protein [Actinomycetota bacterium]
MQRLSEDQRSFQHQRSFDDLGTPLHQVTFCVVDLETTGASPTTCAITEFGAVKVRGGECLGTFQTLVNPGMAIPPEIVVLTGITESMVIPAPPVHNALAAFLEFAGDAVLVGHNVRFDMSFLQAAAVSGGYPTLANRVVDTCALARRLVRDEVPNCRLSTLAERLRLAHRPSHRALDDALATVDLLHALLERAGNLGVLGLDDLLELPTIRAHPQVGKLRLTASLPRQPGVYLFRGLGGRVLYVGKATELRSRVRSYFSGDERRTVSQLLRETVTIDHIVCPGPLEAGVLEVRLIHRHLPPFNRRSKLWRRYAYLKLTLDERFPRLSVVRAARDDGCLYLGPLSSSAAARQVAEAIESAVPIRRCTGRPGRVLREWPCSPAQLGATTCPCAGTVSEADYAILVDQVVAGLTDDPALLLEPLRRRMTALAEAERFEEAAVTRDRAPALARALHRQRRLDRLRRAGRVELELAPRDGSSRPPRRLVLDCGRLLDAADSDHDTLDLWPAECDAEPEPDDQPDVPLARHLVDELACVASWLDAEAHRLRLVHCDGELASFLPPVPLLSPTPGDKAPSSDRRAPVSAGRGPRP